MTGTDLKNLRLSMGVTRYALAVEAGVSDDSTRDSERAKKLQQASVTKYIAALTRIALRRREEAERAQTAALLAIVAD